MSQIYDTDGSGELDKEEFLEILNMAGDRKSVV